MAERSKLRAEDIRAYAGRPWSDIGRHDARQRAAQHRLVGSRGSLEIGEALWEHAKSLHPHWPTPRQRAADLRHHQWMSDTLRRLAHAFEIR